MEPNTYSMFFDVVLLLLNRSELAGVIAHELAHIKHRDTLIRSEDDDDYYKRKKRKSFLGELFDF